MQSGGYMMKRILFNSSEKSILTQNANGPCPLIAIINLLILQNKVFIHSDYSFISHEQLISFIADSLMEAQSHYPTDENRRYRINDAIISLPKYSTGLDVNVKFNKVTSFEFTADCEIFELLHINLVHGWVVETREDLEAFGLLSYNQAIDLLISFPEEEKSQRIKSFFDNTGSQLTRTGLAALKGYLAENQLAVFFRNNHFSTIIKHHNEIFVLATDIAFTEVDEVVWEWLGEVSGDNHYCTSDFVPLGMQNPIRDNYDNVKDNAEGRIQELAQSNGIPKPEVVKEIVEKNNVKAQGEPEVSGHNQNEAANKGSAESQVGKKEKKKKNGDNKRCKCNVF